MGRAEAHPSDAIAGASRSGDLQIAVVLILVPKACPPWWVVLGNALVPAVGLPPLSPGIASQQRRHARTPLVRRGIAPMLRQGGNDCAWWQPWRSAASETSAFPSAPWEQGE